MIDNKRRIRSSKIKKVGSEQAKAKQRTNDVKDYRSWAPGTFILFDNRHVVLKNQQIHVGLGLVIANDDSGKICVIWGSNCRDRFSVYDCSKLNREVIFHVGAAP